MKEDWAGFVVTLGVFVGAELVGLYLLHRLEEIQAKEFDGMYRDEALHVVDSGGRGKLSKSIRNLGHVQE